jgi:hypothetical protein
MLCRLICSIVQSELGLPLTPEELKKAMGRLDSNGDGTLEQAEFVSWSVSQPGRQSQSTASPRLPCHVCDARPYRAECWAGGLSGQ